MRTVIATAMAIWFNAICAAAQSNAPGQEALVAFQGRLVGEFLEDGRLIRLLEPYTYVDPQGQVWPVPAQTVVDGASIPRVFWSVIGGPLEGRYRNASVIHDYYCDRKTKSWQAVHRVFFDAMRESGVEELQAKVMYYAVYAFGPRWEKVLVDTVALDCLPPEGQDRCTTALRTQEVLMDLPSAFYDGEAVKKDLELILSTNPDLTRIEEMVQDGRTREPVP